MAFPHEEDVLRLDIAVDYARRMGSNQTRGNLLCYLQHSIDRSLVKGKPLGIREIAASHERHHEKLLFRGVAFQGLLNAAKSSLPPRGTEKGAAGDGLATPRDGSKGFTRATSAKPS